MDANQAKEAAREIVLVNQKGLHVRAAMVLVDRAQLFQSEIDLTKDGKTVSAKSILGVMTLGAEVGSLLTLAARGSDAVEAVEDLSTLVAQRFGEDC